MSRMSWWPKLPQGRLALKRRIPSRVELLRVGPNQAGFGVIVV